MTQGEVLGTLGGPTFVERARSGSAELLAAAPRSDLTIVDYLGIALRGGYPQAALAADPGAADLWAAGYLEQLLTLDVAAMAPRADKRRLAAYFEAWCLNSAGVIDQSALIEQARVNRQTADSYDALLERLFVVEEIPAWWSNRLARLTSRPKRLVVDTALMAAALRLDLDGLKADGRLIGRFVETFVAMQLRPQLAVASGRPRLFHLRDKGGRHEVDFVIEYGGGAVVAIEVKATAAPRVSDARHLLWLRDRLGDRFAAGVLLHTGPAGIALADGVAALPLAALWS